MLLQVWAPSCAFVGPALALRLWANSEQLKDHNAFVFLDAKGNEEASRTYWSVWTQSGGVAQAMRSRWGVRTGDRVLLVYPPGIDFVVAFLACLRAGAVAVPAYPPDPKRLDNQADALHAIAKDAGAPVNAASILGVISLGVEHGDYVTLTADGEGAEAALDTLSELLTTDHDAA